MRAQSIMFKSVTQYIMSQLVIILAGGHRKKPTDRVKKFCSDLFEYIRWKGGAR